MKSEAIMWFLMVGWLWWAGLGQNARADFWSQSSPDLRCHNPTKIEVLDCQMHSVPLEKNSDYTVQKSPPNLWWRIKAILWVH